MHQVAWGIGSEGDKHREDKVVGRQFVKSPCASRHQRSTSDVTSLAPSDHPPGIVGK